LAESLISPRVTIRNIWNKIDLYVVERICRSYWERDRPWQAQRHSCSCRIYPRQTTYPIESCNTGLRGHLCTYIRACSNVEMGEEYFITMRQIMLNMLRFPCLRGDVRYYVDIFWMPTMRPIIPFDMELQGNALAFIYAYNKKTKEQFPELSPRSKNFWM